MKRKLLTVLLVFCMVLSVLPMAALAADYKDTEGHWAEAQIDRWSTAGVVVGTGDGFDPNGGMTRAAAASMFTKLMKLSEKADVTKFTDLDTTAWYMDDIAKANAAGILNGNDNNEMQPDDDLTREMMFVMVARALGLKEADTATKEFPDDAKTDSWAEGYINALVNMGVISGTGDGKLDPLGDIDRASVMKTLDSLIGGYANTDGQSVAIVEGKITLIVADNVKVTGTADPDLPIVIAGETKTVDLAGVTGDEAPVVQVQVSDVAITNAPVGTEIKAAEDVTGVTANGIDVSGDADKDVVIPDPTPTTPSTPAGPSGPSAPTTYTVTFYATWGSIDFEENKDTFGKTCFGGDNKDGTFYSVSASVEAGNALGNAIPKVTARSDEWIFKGWSLTPGLAGSTKIVFAAVDKEGSTDLTEEAQKKLSELPINGDMKLYAVWQDPAGSTCYGGENGEIGSTGTGTEPETITVTLYATLGCFDAEKAGTVEGDTCYGGKNADGKVLKVQTTLSEDKTVGAIAIEPTWENGEFIGWSNEAFSKDTLTSNTVLSEGATLYAVWKDNNGNTCYGGESGATGSTSDTDPTAVTVTFYAVFGQLKPVSGVTPTAPETCFGGDAGAGKYTKVTLQMKQGDTIATAAAKFTGEWTEHSDWTIKGWATALNTNQTVSETTALVNNQSYYAVWQNQDGTQTCYGGESTATGTSGGGTGGAKG